MNIKKYRVGIIFLIIMIVLQITLPSILHFVEMNSMYTLVFDNNFRFGESVDKVVLDAFIGHIKKEHGFKIVFIGDSVVEGAMVKDNNTTIPAYYKELAVKRFPQKDIKVYNLGIPGNRPSDIYFTLKKLNENNAADLIIMNINYAFYSDEMLKSVPIARPDLFENEMDKDSAKILGLKYSSIENFFQGIAKKWNLYGMREDFSYYLFGKNPREKLFETTQDLQLKIMGNDTKNTVSDANNLDKVWLTNKPFPEDKINHWVQVFNIGKINDDNKGYYFLEKINKEIKISKVKTISFLTPMNIQMIDELNLMKYGSNFDSNIMKINNDFSNNGQTILDYTRSINSDEFNDLFHLTKEGNKHLAEKLMFDAGKEIETEVGR